jgi:hypothetical protein
MVLDGAQREDEQELQLRQEMMAGCQAEVEEAVVGVEAAPALHLAGVGELAQSRILGQLELLGERAALEEEQLEEELGEEHQGQSEEEPEVGALLGPAKQWLGEEAEEGLVGEELRSLKLLVKKWTRQTEEVGEEVGEWGSQTQVFCLQLGTGGDSLSNL